MIISTRNILADSAPKTFFATSLAAGTNVIPWKNPNGFGISWGLQLGETGQEQTEIVILSSSTPAGSLGTLTANTLYPHAADTPIYGIKYDQVVFERSTLGTTGSATPLSNGTITIQPDNSVTIFDDTSGSVSYAYKTLFRASALSVNSTESDWITNAGFSFYSLAGLRQRVKDRVWSAKSLTDDVIDDWMNEWKDELTNTAIAVNEDYAIGTVDVAFGTAGYGTITSTDFKQVRRLWVTFNGSDYFRSTKMDSNDFDPSQQFNATIPKHAYEGDSIFRIKPDGQAGTARLEYYKLNARLVNDADELPVPMRGYTKSFIDYGESLALGKDGKPEEAKNKLLTALAAKKDFRDELSPRDKTGQTYIDIIEPTSGDDSILF